jgi:23S rRNA pseudouridine1911/1915/1917 synthase
VNDPHREAFLATSAGRLDLLLVEQFPEYSRSQLQRLIREGHVLVEGAQVTKTGFATRGGERIEVTFAPARPSSVRPEPIELQVIFENSDVLVVNKPAGTVVHPAAGHQAGTLVNAALAHASDFRGVGGECRPGVVHRLDRDTSGVILMAKHEQAYRYLQAQFKRREVRKKYLALVDGVPPTPSGKIDAPIARDPTNRKKMAVVQGNRGKPSVTEYHTHEHFQRHTLLDVYPQTGRTHQIRVHLAFIGCPVVGDRQYGRRKPSIDIPRQFLHAAELTIRLPGEAELRTLAAALPTDLVNVLEELRAQAYRPRGGSSQPGGSPL